MTRAPLSTRTSLPLRYAGRVGDGVARARYVAVHHALCASDAFEPLAFGGADEALWADCDLASLAENRLGDRTDPRAIDEARRAEWVARATTEAPRPPSRHAEYDRPYWLLEDGTRVGTVAISTQERGGRLARISSLYVFPDQRSRGMGMRALGRVRAILHAHALGLRLETDWAWQRAVRLYLREGLWLRMWKRDLEFMSYPGDPLPILTVGESHATLAVELESGERLVLEEAKRNGTDLTWTSSDAVGRGLKGPLGEVALHAMSTLSLALAVAGWPLVRSEEHWRQGAGSDTGPPEALARRITHWEAWDRDHGFLVDTPRIPGLAYPTWQELIAR